LQVAQVAKEYMSASSAAQDRIAALEARVQQLSDSLQSAEARVDELQNDATASEQRLEQSRAEALALQEKRDQAQRCANAQLAQAAEADKAHRAAASAWKKERAVLLNQRDGAMAQVEALRDKISALSNDLATAQQSVTNADVRSL
jgi:chromosome segregation ATPase